MKAAHFGWKKGQAGKEGPRLFLGPPLNPPITLWIPKYDALG
jgi:hypothetical protein